jgi:hypothetical protein
MQALIPQSIVMLCLTVTICGVTTNSARTLPVVNTVTQTLPSPSRFPDKLIASRTVVGYFQHFLWGDYFYAVVKTDRGNLNFMLDRPVLPTADRAQQITQQDLNCFLADRQGVRLSIRYDRLNRYLPQAGGYYPIDVIRDLKTDRTDLAQWRRAISPAQLQQCSQKIDRATKSS